MSKLCAFQGCMRGARGELCFVHKPRKAIRKSGKKTDEWNAVRNSWIIRHGTYHPCYRCGKPLNELTLTLDHVIPRSNAQNYANRHADNNLRPCCWNCNSEKGSKH